MARRTKQDRSGTPALVAAERAGVAHTVHEHAHDPHAEGELGPASARAMGVDPDRVFKTLVAEAGGRLVVAVVPVSRHLDLKALARAVGAKKAQLAEPAAAERATGYVVGGISPLGQRTTLPTVVDDSALAHHTIIVSAGRRSLKLEIDPTDLVALCGATLAPIRTPD